MSSPYVPLDDLDFDDDDASVKRRGDDVPPTTSSADLDPDASQDPRHVEPGPAIEFQQLVVPDGAHLGPTIGDGPDDLPPYTAQDPE